jgi:hypothetical protein
LPVGLLDPLGEFAEIRDVNPAVGDRYVGVRQPEPSDEAEKGGVDVAAFGTANVVPVDVGVRVVGLLKERSPVKSMIVFGDRDGFTVGVVLSETPFPASVLVGRAVGVIAIGPRREGLLFDVAHPLLGGEPRGRIDVVFGIREVGAVP